MADTQIGFGYLAAPGVYEETALGATAQQAKVGQVRPYNVDIDNQSNAIIYVKFWYAAVGDVQVGTTAPDEIYPVPTITRINHVIVQADDVKFNVGLTMAAVTTGGTGGSTPGAAGNVGVRVTMDM